MEYIMCFFCSGLLLWMGTKRYENVTLKIRKADVVLIILGLLIPAILAALRNPTVGSDVNYYVVPFFNRACNSDSFSHCLKIIGSSDVGYVFLNYIISRLTVNIGWFFFAIEFIIVLFFFLGSWNYRENINPALSMLFWYFISYNMTLSTVRQSIALAIVFYGVSILIFNEFQNRSILKAVICVVIASLFHTTAIISFLLIILIYLIYDGKISKYKIAVGVAFVTVCIKLLGDKFISLVVMIASLLGSKYATWEFISSSGIGASGYSTLILLGTIITFISWFLIKRDKEETVFELNKILFTFNIIYVFMMLTCSNITFVPRMLYYVQMVWCLTLAQSGRMFKRNKTNAVMGISLVLLIVMVYWYYFFCLSNVHGTFPYMIR